MLNQYLAAVEEYMTRLQFQNLSPKTIRSYEQTTRLFGDYLAENPTDDLYEAVEGWKESMLRNGNKPSTVNARLNILGIFFTKATKRSFPKELRFSENPVKEVENVKQITRPYDDIMSDDKVALLYVNEPPRNAKNSLWARNFAIVQLLLNEKIRRDELLSLTLNDIDFVHKELVVENGKGRKERIVDLTDMSAAAISAYLASGIRPAVSDAAPLFGTTSAKIKGAGATQGEEAWHKGSGAWVAELVERHVFNVTGVPSVRPHDLRHIGSRICLNAGTSMEELQGALGHSSITTTQIYANRVRQRARREDARAVLAARDEAAHKLQSEIEAKSVCFEIAQSA